MNDDERYEMKGRPLQEITLENICGTKDRMRVSFWAPRREEIQRFVEIAKAVHKGEGRPKILDVGCGTGFLAYLLAETGEVTVVGLDPDNSLIENSPYSHPHLKLVNSNSHDAVQKYKSEGFAVVVNSWMPGGLNLTPDIRNINANAIIYIKYGETTGIHNSDYKEFFYENGFDFYSIDAEKHRTQNPIRAEDGISYHPGNNYKRVFEWSGVGDEQIRDYVRFINHQSGSFSLGSSRNIIDIQLRKNVRIPKIPRIKIVDSDKYAWEKELDNLGKLEPIRRYYSTKF